LRTEKQIPQGNDRKKSKGDDDCLGGFLRAKKERREFMERRYSSGDGYET